MSGTPRIADGKSCGDCGLCCKLMGVESIAKPQFVWCREYKRGLGCRIYADRPHDCGAFVCYWLHMPNLDEAWRPDRAGFLMHIAEGGARLNIEVTRSTRRPGSGSPTTPPSGSGRPRAASVALCCWCGWGGGVSR